MDRSDERYYLLKTEIMRARNQVWDAVNSSARNVEDALALFDKAAHKGKTQFN